MLVSSVTKIILKFSIRLGTYVKKKPFLIRWFISIEEKRDLKERLGYSETGTNQLHWNGDRGQFPKHFFPQGSGNGH